MHIWPSPPSDIEVMLYRYRKGGIIARKIVASRVQAPPVFCTETKVAKGGGGRICGTLRYYITLLAKFDNRCSTVWAHRQDQWEGNNYSLSLRRMRKRFFLQRIFGRDFLSLCTTIFSGIANYPSASISCCSDDLAQLLPCLDL